MLYSVNTNMYFNDKHWLLHSVNYVVLFFQLDESDSKVDDSEETEDKKPASQVNNNNNKQTNISLLHWSWLEKHF